MLERVPISRSEAARIVAWVSQDLVRQGIIDPKNKTDEELIKEIIELGKAGVKLIDDHRPDLLRQARLFARADELRLSCLLYATWFEHWLNNLISTYGEWKGLYDKEIIQILRDTNFDAKATWLLRIFGAKPLNTSHKTRMKQITEL